MKPTAPPPMDLQNLRSLGVRSVVASCACGRETIVNVDALPASMAVPSVRERLRCGACGNRPEQTRPNWLEHRAHGSGIRLD